MADDHVLGAYHLPKATGDLVITINGRQMKLRTALEQLFAGAAPGSPSPGAFTFDGLDLTFDSNLWTWDQA